MTKKQRSAAPKTTGTAVPSTHRNQHMVSACLAHNFTGRTRGKDAVAPLKRVGRIGAAVHPRSISSQRTIAAAHPKEFEEIWSDIESDAGPVLIALRTRDHMTAHEEEALKALMALHMSRSLSMIPLYEADIDAGRVGAGSRSCLTAGSAGGSTNAPLRAVPTMNEFRASEDRVAAMVLKDLGPTLYAVLNCPARLVVPAGEDCSLLLGDVPVCALHDPDGRLGFLGLYMPLHPRLGIIVDSDGPTLRAAADEVDWLNETTVRRCVNEVYAHPDHAERLFRQFKALLVRGPDSGS